VLPNQVSNK